MRTTAGPMNTLSSNRAWLVDKRIVLQLYVISDDHSRAHICAAAHDAVTAEAGILRICAKCHTVVPAPSTALSSTSAVG